MSIEIKQVGRNLHFLIEGLEPYIVKPLAGKYGEMLTAAFIKFATEGLTDTSWAQGLRGAVDGFTEEGDPVMDGENFQRFNEELSMNEAERIIMASFLWQSVLGIKGVQAYLDEEDPVIATLKAIRALTFRLGASALMTSPNSVSVNAPLPEDLNTTSSHPVGENNVKQPWYKKRKA